MQKIALELKWAFIFIAAGLVWMLLEKLSGLHDAHIDQHAFYTNFFVVVAVGVYWLALSAKRKALGGTISFKKAFGSGLLMTLFITILTPLWQYLSVEVISPSYFGNMINYTVEKKLMTADAAQSYFNLKNYMISSLLFAPVTGIVTAALIALILSHKKAV
jgi:hypothetical protein